MSAFVLTSIFDHLIELVIVLAVVTGFAGVCLTMVGLCVFAAVLLAHALKRPSADRSYVRPVAFGGLPDPAYDASFRDGKVEEKNWMTAHGRNTDATSAEELDDRTKGN